MIFAFYFFILFTLGSAQESGASYWTWECNENKECWKSKAEENKEVVSLSACRVLCDEYGSLWPKPTGNIHLGKKLLQLNPNSVDVLSNKPDSPASNLMREAAKRFKEHIVKRTSGSIFKPGGRTLLVNVNFEDADDIQLKLDTDEGYKLVIYEASDGRIIVTITARNFFGGRNGLETLGQLIIFDDIREELQVLGNASISDKPVFPYRGILLDTARNYISTEAIMRTIDAMGASKLNTFHWHMTDSQSFPFVSRSNPKMSLIGAYSPKKVYTPEAIQEVIQYAKVRGVRVIPEFDAPAHVGEGWQETDVVECFNAQPWSEYCVEPPCGQLDPTNKNLYNILEGIYGDIVELFKPDIFHMGGDEVNLHCWNSTVHIVDWMSRNYNWGQTESDFMKLWDVFQSQALERLEKKLGKKVDIIMWTSTLTKPEYVEKYLPNTQYIIQIWTTGSDAQVKQLLDKNYRLILSNYDALYFDCGFEAWVTEGNNWCSPYIGWQKVYENSPRRIAGEDKKKLILGSEATLWTEQVDDTTVDSRLWPRSASMAETLWSEPTEGWRLAERRMLIHRERLVEIGVRASAMQPQWCMQYQGDCPI